MAIQRGQRTKEKRRGKWVWLMPSGAELYGCGEWQRARRDYLASHPRCTLCGEKANTVDHVKPHKGSLELFWNKQNWQSLCANCHGRHKQSAEHGPKLRSADNDGLPVRDDHPWNR